MVYVLIFQKPLKIQVYSSLVALIEDNGIEALGASKSKLEKWKFDQFDYVTYKVIISKRKLLTSGDVRRGKAIELTLWPSLHWHKRRRQMPFIQPFLTLSQRIITIKQRKETAKSLFSSVLISI